MGSMCQVALKHKDPQMCVPREHTLGLKMEIRRWDTAVYVGCHTVKINSFIVLQPAYPCD